MKQPMPKPGSTPSSGQLAELTAALTRSNRMLEIEAALERVRSAAMSMKSSADLSKTVAVLYEQMDLLSENPEQLSIAIMNEPESVYEMWVGRPGRSDIPMVRLPFGDPFVMDKVHRSWKANEKSLTIDMQGKELAAYQRFRKKVDIHAVLQLKGIKRRVIYAVNFAHGSIALATHEPRPAETLALLGRFAAVFDQAYTRFLDLQKAEHQAREAQIEAALERVRARTMAMHKSEDLLSVIPVLAEQMIQLGFNIHSANFNTTYNEKDWNLWLYNPGSLMQPIKLHVPYFDHPFFNRTLESLAAGNDFTAFTFTQAEKDAFLDHLYTNTVARDVHPERRKFTYDKPGFAWSSVYLKNTAVTIANYDAVPYTEEQNIVFRKFANVFEQSYVRFLDLQKAEVQAKEAQVEAGLERVRARAMSMRSSEELNVLIGMVFRELTKLDLVLTRCTIMIFDPATKDSRWWMLNAETPDQPNNYFVPFHTLPPYMEILSYWEQKSMYWSYELQGKVKKQWDAFLFSKTGLKDMPPAVIAGMKAPARVLLSGSSNSFGCLNTASLEPLTDEQVDILLRFANVFDLTYTRFNDLKQAETAVREATIETALERIRSKTMAMHSSSDVSETVVVTFDELQKLGIEMYRCGVGIFHQPRIMEVWTARNEGTERPDMIAGRLNMTGHPMLVEVFDAWERGDSSYQYTFSGDDLSAYLKVINDAPGYPVNYDITTMPEKQFNYDFYFPEGNLFTFTLKPLSAESIQIFKRFAAVFGQTYRRYLDLCKAEAQAREAQIESSLERVRGRAMAMQQAEDVLSICALLFTELQKQGFTALRNTMINIHDDDKGSFLNYDYSENAGKNITHYFYNHHPVIEKLVRQTRSATDAFSEIILSGKELTDWRSFRTKSGEKDDARLEELSELYYYFYSIGTGAVGISTFQPLIGDQLDILKRFRNVFELAYRRYIDITTAAAQAREAQIEAALERVRAKAMAMHDSNDVSTAASMVFTELRKLGINPIRSGVGLLKADNPAAQLYTATSTENGDSLALIGHVSLQTQPVLKNILEHWKEGKDYFPELSGEELRNYYRELATGLSVSPEVDASSHRMQYGHFISVSIGCLYAWSETRYNEQEIRILSRFAGIVDLTFRRYMELQQSEANARDAVKDASLDRVRAEIASMRTTADLERIIPLIWHELTVLDIPFIRCGVFIMDDDQRQIHTFLSTPDGKAIAAFHLSYDSHNMKDAVKSWRENRLYTVHWDKADFLGLATTLVAQGAISSQEQYLASLPAAGVHLHFLPFLQGMLYVGNTCALAEDQLTVLQSVADAFSTAYARYEDFVNLETAKTQVEKTLSELKLAQQQLVQAEKMASLGELTAGIAHEIQNPLNFVNNFSEVSNELLQEMKAELDRGDTTEAKNIAKDVQDNLQKILHHGKRADGIVKGMLQHSRSGTGQKEPIDINKLTDEYLRLAYHGLRAKDKSFNVKFNTHLDPAIGSVQVVAQDIGRVILNLINNAFYAVNEKQKQQLPGYDGIVTVQTRKENGRIEIEVTDNGNGIPVSVINKIFQPFFTTKPTGQGTGLGLSLSYDIITKGHGGELRVETAEGRGTSFIIQLPE